MHLHPKDPNFPHSAVLHAIVSKPVQETDDDSDNS